LATVLLTVAPIRSGSPASGEYDAWLDWNDDGMIDIKDVSRVARAFGTNGTNVSKVSIEYDSGWVDISGMAGQNITVTHGLNVTDWNDENIDASIIGRTSPDEELQRYVGLTGHIQGWNQTYGGTSLDEARHLVQTADGGYALAGYTNSSGAGGYDSWLVKTDTSGNMQWNKTYGGTHSDFAFGLVQASDGGYALAGGTTSFGAGSGDAWLVKTDAAGTVQWNQTYGGADSDSARGLVQTSDGGYALAGRTGSPPADYDFWLVKTDASGTEQWNQTYGGTNTDWAFAVVQMSDGGYVLAGYTYSLGAGNADAWLIRTDATGNIMWNQTYGGTKDDWALTLVQTADGGYALAGMKDYIYSKDGLVGDFWLIKTDANGNVGGVESGLAWIDSSANTATLYRGATDTSWNYVRVRLWKPR
jgi:hypothetical protein